MTGGVIQEYDVTNSRALVACVDGQPQQVSISELNSLVGGTCTDTNWDSSHTDSGYFGLTCNSAAERYCLNQGAAGGVIQNFNTTGNSAIVLCLSGARFVVPVSTLDGLLGTNVLDAYPWNDTWHGLYYNSAAGRYCRSKGYNAGVIQEWDGKGNSTITCF